MSLSQQVLSAVFSDETPFYRFPSEPDVGDTVNIRIRVAKGSAERVILLTESLKVGTLMEKKSSDDSNEEHLDRSRASNDHAGMREEENVDKQHGYQKRYPLWYADNSHNC